jgi:hypothetical protein
MTASLNVYGKSLENCSCNPMIISAMVFVIRYQRILDSCCLCNCDKWVLEYSLKKEIITQS